MSNPTTKEIENKQKRVAYALNMCTVSVSQIIDYDDIYILDQEYDAILNKLNLEEMPKDAPLREVLEELLDVITHFRVSEIEKQFVEKEYQLKMKNAIWAAVPNFGLILAGGNPLTMALSLASQVGIGYMNYRRNKNEYGLDRERQMWHLKRQAIEQFNYLRKKLFDCAWRLADEHQFPDSYRLTENQINHYNQILQDQDVRRKFERLEDIQGDFEAYPPFWYFIGNAANLIANDTSINLSAESRAEFRKKALTYFKKFESIEQNSILREDLLSASCALEHIDILLLEGKRDSQTDQMIYSLISKADRMSGYSLDIKQLCAVAYLKIKKTDEAVKILKKLVNEDYNRIVNAQILSAIYAHSIEKYKADYEILASRVDTKYLFPIPENNQDIALLETKFEFKRRLIAQQELHVTLNNYVQKYAIQWNKILSTFETSKEYPDDFFYDNETAKAKRKIEAEKVFGNARLKSDYQGMLVNSNYEPKIRSILNDFVNGLFLLSFFSDKELENRVEQEIRNEILSNRNSIDKIKKAINGRSFQMSDYVFSQTISLASFIESALQIISQYGNNLIEKASNSRLTEIESELLAFCTREKIELPEVAIEKAQPYDTNSHSSDRFNPELFGHQAVVDQKNADFLSSMVQYVRDRIVSVTIIDNQIEVLMRDEPKFNGYFKCSEFNSVPSIEAHAIMVIHDKSQKGLISLKSTTDLIFTTDGIITVQNGKVSQYITPYSEVKLENDKLVLYNGKLFEYTKFSHPSIDKLALAEIVSGLSKKFIKDLGEYIEYIPGVIKMSYLLEWFKKDKRALASNVDRIIAIPSKENLDHLGYSIRAEIDTSKNIIQCYYESDTA